MKIDSPYDKFKLYELNLNEKSLTLVEHDNFRSKVFINGNVNRIAYTNEIQFPATFETFE